MMISPEQYYDDNLQGKSPEEILRQIRSLKQKIGKLKRLLENESLLPEDTARHDSLEQIGNLRKCLNEAIRAYGEAGGVYIPSRAEVREQEFNHRLQFIKKLVFSQGSFLDGYEVRTYTVSGDEVRIQKGYPGNPEPPESSGREVFSKEEFVQTITDTHIGEWKKVYDNPHVLDGTQWSIRIEYENGLKPVHIWGSNAFPYNYSDAVWLLDVLEAYYEDPLAEEIIWFEKDENQTPVLVKENGERVVSSDHSDDFDITPQCQQGWQRSMLYIEAKGIWDITAFGAEMDGTRAYGPDAEGRCFTFTSCEAADRWAYQRLVEAGDLTEKQVSICRKYVDEFYADPELQKQWQDVILFPVCLILREDGSLEPVSFAALDPQIVARYGRDYVMIGDRESYQWIFEKRSDDNVEDE